MSLRLKAGISLIVLALGVLILTPTLLSPWVQSWPEPIQRRMLKLGLDLKGGVHLVFEIDKAKHEETLLYRLLGQLKTAIRDSGHDFVSAGVHQGTIGISLLDETGLKDVEAQIPARFPELRLLKTHGSELILKLDPTYAERTLREASSRAVEIIRSHIDQFGVAEPDVRREASGRILEPPEIFQAYCATLHLPSR